MNLREVVLNCDHSSPLKRPFFNDFPLFQHHLTGKFFMQIKFQIDVFHILYRRCDLAECQSQPSLFVVLYGCEHSYHRECLYRESCQGACSICAKNLKVQMQILAAKADDAIFNPSATVNDGDDDGNDDDPGDDDDDDDNNVPEVTPTQATLQDELQNLLSSISQ